MPRAGSGPIRGCEEPCLANWSAISFPSIPQRTGIHTNWILLCSASFTRDWWQSKANSELVWKLSRALMATWVSERILTVYPFYIFSITQDLMVYISALTLWCRAQGCSSAPFSGPIYTLQHSTLTALGPTSTPDQPHVKNGLNPFCHSHLSRNLTVNCLWYHPLSLHMRVRFMLHVPTFSSLTEICEFRFPLMAAH